MKQRYEVIRPKNDETLGISVNDESITLSSENCYEILYVGEAAKNQIICIAPDKERADIIRNLLEENWLRNRPPIYRPFWEIDSVEEVQ